MKILLIGELSWSYVIGSSTQKVQKNIFEELKRNNVNAYFYELTPSEFYLKKIFGKIVEYDNHLLQGGLVRIWFRILKSEFDLIHLLVLRNYMLCFIPLIFLRQKILILVHDTLSIRNLIPKKLNHFVRLLFIKSAVGVFVFNKSDEQILRTYRKDSNTIFTVKQGINLEFIKQDLLTIHSNNTILFSGGIGKDYKGLKFLRDALSQVKASFKLNVYGPNYSCESDKDYIGAFNEENYYKVLKHSRLVVVPSEYESFSLTVIEALAVGIPVILTQDCGITDYLVDGKDCLIVNYNDFETLANKIDLLLQNNVVWEEMRKNALSIAKEFEWRSIISTYINIYYKLIDE